MDPAGGLPSPKQIKRRKKKFFEFNYLTSRKCFLSSTQCDATKKGKRPKEFETKNDDDFNFKNVLSQYFYSKTPEKISLNYEKCNLTDLKETILSNFIRNAYFLDHFFIIKNYLNNFIS